MKTLASKQHLATSICAALLAGFAPLAGAQSLLYQWNFDNATGNGSTFTAAPSAGSGSLGTLTDLNSGVGPSAPAGSGLTGAAGDLALVQPTYGAGGAGAVGGQLGDLSSLSSFTVSLWFNLNSTVTNFGNMNGQGGLNARLFNVANSASGDGNRLYFALNTGTNLQFGVNNAGSSGVTLGAGAQGQGNSGAFGLFGNASSTMTNNWIFVAGVYNTALNGTVSLYMGSQTTAASFVGSLTNVGTIAWDASGDDAYVGNRPSNGNRALPGSIDDVRLYNGVADQNFINNNIQGVPEPGTLALVSVGAGLAILRIRRRCAV